MQNAERETTRGDGLTRRSFLKLAGAGAVWLGAAPLGPARDRAAWGAEPVPTGPVDWAALRSEFLLPEGLVYMNNGTLGPCPKSVVAAAVRAWNEMEANPADEYYGTLIRKAEEARAKAAEFLGCALDELAITNNTTDAMNTVAQGLELERGQRVLTTDHEHAGGSVCWEYYARRRGVQIDKVTLPVPPKSSEEVLKLIAAKLTPQTKVISVSHVTFTTGLRLPIRQIAELDQTNGSLLVVDGAQAPGVLDVNVKELGCHAYATSAHKWMLAPKGTGLLYISNEARKLIDPLPLHHGYGVYTGATGTRNLPAVIGLGGAITFLNLLRGLKVQERALQLRQMAYEGLAQIPKVTVASPATGEMVSALTTISLPGSVSNGAFGRALRDKHRVIVRVVSRGKLNGIRISTHIYNSEDDVEKLIRAVKKELG